MGTAAGALRMRLVIAAARHGVMRRRRHARQLQLQHPSAAAAAGARVVGKLGKPHAESQREPDGQPIRSPLRQPDTKPHFEPVVCETDRECEPDDRPLRNPELGAHGYGQSEHLPLTIDGVAARDQPRAHADSCAPHVDTGTWCVTQHAPWRRRGAWRSARRRGGARLGGQE